VEDSAEDDGDAEDGEDAGDEVGHGANGGAGRGLPGVVDRMIESVSHTFPGSRREQREPIGARR